LTRPAIPRMETERLIVEMPVVEDADRIRDFYERNREYFGTWEPDHGAFIYTTEFWQRVLPTYVDEYKNGQAMRVILREKTDLKGPIAGFLHYTQFAGGALMSACFGCNLDKSKAGYGLMQEAGSATANYLFKHFNMHRINAYYMPTNIRSAKMLRRLGYKIEGYIRDYLFINDRWRDHVATALINPQHAEISENFVSVL
jgi:ribosomal-protein-alanine N-acetyltransferase